MPLFVTLPAGVPVFIRATANSTIQQRVTLTRSDGSPVAQWEGRGDNADIGGMSVTPGTISLPDTGVNVLVESRWDAPNDTTFIEEDCFITESGGAGWYFKNVNCDDRGGYPGAGPDGDHDDTIVAFWWFAGGWDPIAKLALKESGADMKKALADALKAKKAK